MPFHQVGELRYYTLESFDEHGLMHGFFTRRGGVSPAPWASLNHGGTNGDARENVVENRRRMFDVFGLPVDSIFDCWQVHGRDVLCAEAARPLDSPHQKADGILTNRQKVTLVMRFADCVPVLLYDPIRHVTGIVHAGWQGTALRAVAAAVEQMQAVYGSRPEDILAGIGPSICVDHYEVGRGTEVVEAIRRGYGKDAQAVLVARSGSQGQPTVHLDLWKANQIALEAAGVQKIEQTQICTASDTIDWYSHRAEHGKTGRYGVLLSARTWNNSKI
jgi:YfiH family protein